jgi:hypothetical protein
MSSDNVRQHPLLEGNTFGGIPRKPKSKNSEILDCIYDRLLSASSLVARTSVTRLLVKAKAYALRVAAKGHSTEPRLLRSRGIGFASGLPNQCYRLLQVGDFEENSMRVGFHGEDTPQINHCTPDSAEFAESEITGIITIP